MAEITLNPDQRTIVDRLLQEPFNRLNRWSLIEPVTTEEGYPGVRVFAEDRNGDGVSDQWVVERSLDEIDFALTTTPDREVHNPRDGYLIERSIFRVEAGPSGDGQLLVYGADTVCVNPVGQSLPLICRQFNAMVTDWGRQRYTENLIGMNGFIGEFITPQHGEIPWTSAEQFSNQTDEDESLAWKIVAGVATLLAGVATALGLRARRQANDAEAARVKAETARAEAEARLAETPPLGWPAVPEEGPEIADINIGEPIFAEGIVTIPGAEGDEIVTRRYRIGRVDPGDSEVVRMPEGELGNLYRSVSRAHAEIEVSSDGTVRILDGESSYGTFLLPEGNQANFASLVRINPVLSIELRHGDSVRLGLSWYRVSIEGGLVSFQPYPIAQQHSLNFAVSSGLLPLSPVEPGSIYVGREPGEGGMVLPKATRDVSRRHAEIAITEEGRFLIRTAESRYFPIYLTRDGETYIVPHNAWVELLHGDEVEFSSQVHAFERFGEMARLRRINERDAARSEPAARDQGIADFPVTTPLEEVDRLIRFTPEAQALLAREGLDPVEVVHEVEGANLSDGSRRIEVADIDAYRVRQALDFIEVLETSGTRPALTNIAEFNTVLRVWEALSPERREAFWQASSGELCEARGASMAPNFIQVYFRRRLSPEMLREYPLNQIGGGPFDPFVANMQVAVEIPEFPEERRRPSPPPLPDEVIEVSDDMIVVSERPITRANIALELRDRYPALRAPEYNAVVDALAEEIFAEWERESDSFASQRPAIDGLPSEEFLERSMERLFERMEARSRTAARDAIRGSDQGRRKDRDVAELIRELEQSAPPEPGQPVSQDNIALELRDRYPTLQEPVYNGVVDALAGDIFRSWETEGAVFESGRPAIDGLPSEEFLERSMERLFERMETRRQTTTRDAIRGSDRGRREDRDTSRLEEVMRGARELAERR